MLKVVPASHSYGCHPETCNCLPWAVVNKHGEVLAKFYSKKQAETLLKEARQKD